MRARVFQSGNSQAVRLPKEFRLEVDEVDITQRGGVLILRPREQGEGLAGAFDALASIGEDFLRDGREQGEQAGREDL